MDRHSLVPCLFAALALPSGALPGQTAPLVDPPACYDVRVGDWAPDLGLGADSLYAAPPSRVLLSDSAGAMGSWRRMSVAPRALPSVHRMGGWMAGRDTVALVWSTGFSGLGAVLRGSRERLVVTATTFWDFGREPQTAPIALVRVDCASEPDIAAKDDRPLPDSVRLADGTTLRLDGPMPTSTNLTERDGFRMESHMWGNRTVTVWLRRRFRLRFG